MKLVKRVSSFVLALLMVVTVLAVPTPVEAASKNKVYAYNAHVKVGSFSVICNPTYGFANGKIKKLKSSSSNLIVKQIYQDNSAYDNEYWIQGYAKKEGTYTVTFDVYNGSKKAWSEKWTVYAFKSPVASAKYDGKNIVSYQNDSGYVAASTYFVTNKAKGKLVVKMNKGYKLSKIETGIFDNHGDWIPTATVKNKKKLKLNTEIYSYSGTYPSGGSYWYKSMYADPTNIRIYYKDVFDKKTYANYEYETTPDGKKYSGYTTLFVTYMKKK